MKEKIVKELICPCGKVYKMQMHYDKHIAKCEVYIAEQKEPEKVIIEQEEVIIEPENEKLVPINQEIVIFFTSLNGRTTGNVAEINKMIGWYNVLYPGAPNVDITCYKCVSHVYRTLKKIYNDHKTSKDNKQRCC